MREAGAAGRVTSKEIASEKPHPFGDDLSLLDGSHLSLGQLLVPLTTIKCTPLNYQMYRPIRQVHDSKPE